MLTELWGVATPPCRCSPCGGPCSGGPRPCEAHLRRRRRLVLHVLLKVGRYSVNLMWHGATGPCLGPHVSHLSNHPCPVAACPRLSVHALYIYYHHIYITTIYNTTNPTAIGQRRPFGFPSLESCSDDDCIAASYGAIMHGRCRAASERRMQETCGRHQRRMPGRRHAGVAMRTSPCGRRRAGVAVRASPCGRRRAGVAVRASPGGRQARKSRTHA